MDYFGMSFVKRFHGISSRTPQEMDLVIGNPPLFFRPYEQKVIKNVFIE